ncbi:flagellar hook-length control protein FliK [Acidithiobacillus sp.]|uniref:flagellar hook-length control protein FliK n=1 Tax=Acidithiobacillus sp. TaxID=1872118 RepID=UPI0025BF4D65|nr:flagellar hook-length control protein FliK [Acidithiobacillus sp.]MCK9187610.1 flagellar hook-length control protein FliK [Acidithiobacillus sp.]MCK9358500.1 flagellar hook-length control protein FliK [Acidithiobacillus sp.]
MAAEITSATVSPITTPASTGAPASAQTPGGTGPVPAFAQVMAGQRAVAPASAQGKVGTPEKSAGKGSDAPQKVSSHALRQQVGESSGKTLPVALATKATSTVPAPATTSATAVPPKKVADKTHAAKNTAVAPLPTAMFFSPTLPLAATAAFPHYQDVSGKPTPLGGADESGHNVVATLSQKGASHAAGALETIHVQNLQGKEAGTQAPRPALARDVGVVTAASPSAAALATVSTKRSEGTNGASQPGANLPNMTVLSGVAPTAGPAQAVAVVAPPVDSHPQWGQALGQQVQFLLGQGIQQATLHLNPPHLGPLEVHLDLQQNGQTNAFFISPHPEVRGAIATAMPQLQESFAAAGMSLGQAGVGTDGGGRPFARNKSASVSGIIAVREGTGGVAALPISVRARLGLVNTFA